jgi:hypothetical protein
MGREIRPKSALFFHGNGPDYTPFHFIPRTDSLFPVDLSEEVDLEPSQKQCDFVLDKIMMGNAITINRITFVVHRAHGASRIRD